jgi:hypothetical protein
MISYRIGGGQRDYNAGYVARVPLLVINQSPTLVDTALNAL